MTERFKTYEERDVHPRAIVWFALGLIATLAVSFVAIRWLELRLTRTGATPGSVIHAGLPATVPAPQLQADPAADLQKFHAREEQTLHSYGWVDRKAGVIRIPIERAIELTAERGLPTRKEEKP